MGGMQQLTQQMPLCCACQQPWHWVHAVPAMPGCGDCSFGDRQEERLWRAGFLHPCSPIKSLAVENLTLNFPFQVSDVLVGGFEQVWFVEVVGEGCLFCMNLKIWYGFCFPLHLPAFSQSRFVPLYLEGQLQIYSH